MSLQKSNGYAKILKTAFVVISKVWAEIEKLDVPGMFPSSAEIIETIAVFLQITSF